MHNLGSMKVFREHRPVAKGSDTQDSTVASANLLKPVIQPSQAANGIFSEHMSSPMSSKMDSDRTEAAKGKLLIVDDSLETLKLLSEFLSMSGYQVHCMQGAHQIESTVQRIRPDLILLDINLIGVSGYTICQQLKANVELRAIPIIFISVSDERQDKLKAFSVGGADYITKPFWFEEVQARVANQVTMYRLQQRLKLQTKRALASKGQMPLLADLQRMLHRQATRLKAQNERLQKEIHERKHAEKALRREKYKSEKLLLNILPQAVVDQLKQFQGSLAERFDDATILFADIVNFTPLAAQVTPLELVQLLNQIFSTFDRLAEEHGLEKIKTIGDAYMVVGGLPVPNDNHIEAVINMAIAMQAAIQTFTRADGQPLQLRIGINTGAVVAGVIGIKKFSYDLWGDAVNVASRMESQGVPGKIQVTETTYQRLKHKYYFTPAGEVTIKGKGQMRTYHLAGKVEN